MRLLALSIRGFRGIKSADIRFGDHDVLVGPNGVGKSTIIDALSLVFDRARLVRVLTEHDFYGSCPDATSRIRIIATLAGFEGNDPDRHEGWFRDGRAVPKWWNASSGTPDPEPNEAAETLCAQIAFAARFDLEDLIVESIRYFHDDDALEDPFLGEVVQALPLRLVEDIGFYVLPTRRTWEATASFASDLFRKAVATVGGIPAQTVLDERDRLRRPESPLEETSGLLPLVERINKQLVQIMPSAPRFQLRLTATDSDSLLRALVPHYTQEDGTALPVGRHGMGLLSLQTFILLLELGQERRNQGEPFLLAMEEPELHIPPGMQRRLVSRAVSIAEQTICTSHSPRVAAYYPATSVQILDRRPGKLASTPFLAEPLAADASNAMRKLFNEDRPRVLEALMQHRVLIPEGRTEYEWLRLLSDALETGDQALQTSDSETPPFGTVVGVVPTHDSQVTETFKALRRLRSGLVPLVDGDDAGNGKVAELRDCGQAPELVLQWRAGWTIEDAIGWILMGAEGQAVVNDLRDRLEGEFTNIQELVNLFKVKTGPARLKTNYLAYEDVSTVIRDHAGCRERAAALLAAITTACLGQPGGSALVHADEVGRNDRSLLLRVAP